MHEQRATVNQLFSKVGHHGKKAKTKKGMLKHDKITTQIVAAIVANYKC